MEQTDIQAFLKILQDEIEAGKNLVNMSVSSSIVLKESQKEEEPVPKNPFEVPQQEVPQKPIYEQTNILSQINQSLQWDELENSEPSFYGLQMQSPEKIKEPESPETPKESTEKSKKHLHYKTYKKAWKCLQIYMLQSQIEQYNTYKVQQKRTQTYFFKWVDRCQEEKSKRENEKNEKMVLLKKFKIERILYKNNLKIGYQKFVTNRSEMIKQEKEAKIEQIRNFKALKFWCRKTKQKVFIQGFQLYIAKIQRKRQNGLKIYIFQDGTLKENLIKIVFNSINQYKTYRKQKKINQKWCQENHRKRKLNQFMEIMKNLKQINEQKRLKKIERNMLENYLKSKILHKFLSQIWQEWTEIKNGKKGVARQIAQKIQEIQEKKMVMEAMWKIKEIDGERKQIQEKQEIKINRKSKEKVMESFKQNFEYRKQKWSKVEMVNKFYIKNLRKRIFASLLNAQNLNQTDLQKFEKLTKVLEKLDLKSAFSNILNFSILINFGSNDFLCQKLLKIQYFKIWLQYSLQDRKMLKLQGKAIKFHNRKFKLKIFHAWVQNGLNSEVYRKYAQKLLQTAISSFKKYKIKRKIKKLKQKKWSEFLRSNLLKKSYDLLKKGTKILAVENRQKSLKYSEADDLFALKVQSKVIKALKKYCYQMRVKNYLVQYTTHKTISKYFGKFREVYFTIKTQNYRERQVSSLHNEHLMKFIFQKLKLYLWKSKSKSYAKHRAFHYRFQHLASLSFTLLKYYSQARKVKKYCESKAFEDRNNIIKGEALLKISQVGMYWANIKGRFKSGQKSAAERRIYLAMKYGSVWRAKVQVQKMKNNQQMVSEKIMVNSINQKELRAKLKIGLTNINQNQVQDRINFITQEINKFKQKKVLLQELQQKLLSVQADPKQANLVPLLSQKIENMRQELREKQQNEIRHLVQEIALLKQQETFDTISVSTIRTKYY